MTNSTTPKNFRYDINALRAVAILGVLFFHYKIKWFDGGYAGVDIFFVISGYLMTRIITNGIERNNFSFADFYSKRVKRIMPALIVLIVALTVIGFFIYFPSGYRVNERNGAASLLFVSNILYWQTSNYFAQASDANILLHTWSLSAEWQFYMIYPVILLALFKVLKVRWKQILGILFLIGLSFVVAILWGKRDPTGTFYLLPSRAWEMLFGGLAFLGEDYFSNFKWRKYVAILGYLVNFIFIVSFHTVLRWPGIYTLIPVVATFFIIISNCNNFVLLRNPVVQFIGKTSYSIYLWHWPVYVIAGYVGIELFLVSKISMIVIATVLGYLSYKYVENFNYQKTGNILVVAGSIAVAVFYISYLNINAPIFKPGTVAIEAYAETHEKEKEEQFAGQGCFIGSKEEDNGLNEAACLKIDLKQKNILLIGDSHAAQFSQSLREMLAKRNINLLQATASGCLPILRFNGQRRCQAVMRKIYDEFLKANPGKIDGVILSANWINNSNNNKKLIDDLIRTKAYFDKHGIKMIIIGQNETYDMTYPLIAARENEYGVKIADRYVYKRAAKVNDELSEHFKSYIDVYNAIGGVLPGNVPYMFDRNHYSKPAADLVVSKLLKTQVAQEFLGI